METMEAGSAIHFLSLPITEAIRRVLHCRGNRQLTHTVSPSHRSSEGIGEVSCSEGEKLARTSTHEQKGISSVTGPLKRERDGLEKKRMRLTEYCSGVRVGLGEPTE